MVSLVAFVDLVYSITLMSYYDLIVVLLASMTPIGELRLSIPLAIYSYNLPWQTALLISVLGNMVPVVLLVFGIDKVCSILLRYNNPVGRLLMWQQRRIIRLQTRRFQSYGAVLLVMLVAVPLPMTGAWTGSFAAWTFGIPPSRAIPLIAIGVTLAGIIVTLVTMTGIYASNILLAYFHGNTSLI